MIYPIVLFKDPGSDYGVVVPDLPGCISAGRTMDEALEMAKEAIELHLQGLIEEGEATPEPRSIEEHRKDPEYRSGSWALVAVDTSSLGLRSKRINITMPERVLVAVDRFATERHETRSGLLVKAAAAYISKESGRSRGAGRKVMAGRIRRKGRKG